jgi:hypothetical protein
VDRSLQGPSLDRPAVSDMLRLNIVTGSHVTFFTGNRIDVVAGESRPLDFAEHPSLETKR